MVIYTVTKKVPRKVPFFIVFWLRICLRKRSIFCLNPCKLGKKNNGNSTKNENFSPFGSTKLQHKSFHYQVINY
jgi:hypothetical protein